MSWSTYVVRGDIFADNLDRLLALGDWLRIHPAAWRFLWDKKIHSPDLNVKHNLIRWQALERLFDHLRPTLQTHYLGLMVEEISRTGDLAGGMNGFEKGQSIPEGSLSGIKVYALGQRSHNRRIFSSHLEVMTALVQAVDDTMQKEKDPIALRHLQNYSPVPFLRKADTTASSYQPIIKRERTQMLSWGEGFAAVTGKLPMSRILEKKYGGRFTRNRNFWPSRSAYHEDLRTHMKGHGFVFATDNNTIQSYPEGYALPLRICALIEEIASLESPSQ